MHRTVNDLNAPYMKEFIIPRNSTYHMHYIKGSQNLSVPRVNQTTYSTGYRVSDTKGLKFGTV